MYAQVITGKVTDQAQVTAQWERWNSEVKQGAQGFLGATAGVAADGTFVGLARYESEADAQASRSRPEQTAWREEALAHLGDLQIHESTDVDLILDGGSDEAGFVQVMAGTATDKEAVRELGRSMEGQLQQNRPDVLGGIVVWHDENRFTQFTYFSSEEEARAAEANPTGEGPPEEWMNLFGDINYIDVSKPLISGP